MKQKNVLKNIIMLYGMSIAKIVFPLLTLPYLTRVLSVESNFHRFQKMIGCFLSNCLQAFHNREIVRKNNHVARNCGIFSD